MGNIPDYPAPGRPLADEDQFAGWVDGKQVAVSAKAIRDLTLDDPSFVAVASDLLLGNGSAVRKTAGAAAAITEAAAHIPAIEAAPGAAEEAGAARDEARDWAEGTDEPGGPGSKSAKGWAETVRASGAAISASASIRSALVIADSTPSAKVALLVDAKGRLSSPFVRAGKLNGVDADTLVRNRVRIASSVPADVIAIYFGGQSLTAGGGLGGGFPTPPGRNYAVVRDKNNPTQADIKVYDTSDATLGLPGRMTGMIWMTRQLLLEEDGIPYDLQPIIVISNGAIGGSPISVHQKGTDVYARMIQQSAVERFFGRNMGLRVRHLGIDWGQGESDALASTGAQYYGDADVPGGATGSGLLKLAVNSSADLLEQYPEQAFNPKLLTYATASGIVGPGRRGVARAQHKLAIDRPDICLFSSALYHLPYTYDVGDYPDMQNNAGGAGGGALHTSMIGSIWGGGYEGLARKRTAFDGLDWLPMRPAPNKGFETEGNSAFLTYLVRGDNLRNNAGQEMPALVDNGVVVRDKATGQAVALAQPPRLVGSRIGGGLRTVCLTFATPPQPTWRYEMGLGVNAELYPYKGGATNFTDDYGLTMRCVNKRMFDPMPPHAILPAANAAGFVLTLDA